MLFEYSFMLAYKHEKKKKQMIKYVCFQDEKGVFKATKKLHFAPGLL